jgi:hypothetical protein
MNKSKRVGWAGHVASVGELRNVYRILVRIIRGGTYSEGLGKDRKIILKWLLEKRLEGADWTRLREAN